MTLFKVKIKVAAALAGMQVSPIVLMEVTFQTARTVCCHVVTIPTKPTEAIAIAPKQAISWTSTVKANAQLFL